ncbi:hypothetical protein KM043_012354 [Ampulex compressa]|nr:hypothetical protein KM043_012354 [Ampulex compressa]
MSQERIVGNDLLLEFLEVAFNHILFFRNLYPKEIFSKRKIYGTIVYVCDHPELGEYLRNVLSAIRELTLGDENCVTAVELVFYDKDRAPVEKFVFDLSKLNANAVWKDPYYLKTEEALRVICLKLSTCGTYLKPLPERSTFAIMIKTSETAHIALSENPRCEEFPWIAEEDAPIMTSKDLLPLKRITNDCFALEMFAIEDRDRKYAA